MSATSGVLSQDTWRIECYSGAYVRYTREDGVVLDLMPELLRILSPSKPVYCDLIPKSGGLSSANVMFYYGGVEVDSLVVLGILRKFIKSEHLTQ